MHFIIPQAQLVELIGKIQSIIPSKTVLPILSNILIEAEENSLTIKATDLTVSLVMHTDAKVLKKGSTALPARKFFQLIRELTAPYVEIESSEDLNITIKAGSSRFRLCGMNTSEFPQFPILDQDTWFDISCQKLKEQLSQTVFAAAKDESREALNGTLLVLENQKATFVATDGKRLARNSCEIPFEATEPSQYVIPLKTIEEIIRLLDDNDDGKIVVMRDKIALETPNACIISKLISKNYPDYKKVIPSTEDLSHVRLHKEELITLLKQVSLFITNVHPSALLTFEKGILKIEAASSEVGDSNVSMPIDYNAEPMQIAFNPLYFLDILRHSNDEVISFYFSDAYNPGLFSNDPSSTFVLMPMRIKSPAPVA